MIYPLGNFKTDAIVSLSQGRPSTYHPHPHPSVCSSVLVLPLENPGAHHKYPQN
jgi:hypothetical protein